MNTQTSLIPHQPLFNKAFEKIILIEGGYSHNPLDSGGETCYGITQKIARSHGYTQPMNKLPLTTACQIYYQSYWTARKLGDIAKLSYKLAEKLFDAGVNVGPSRSSRWFQTALNALNNRGKRWEDLHIDGKLGTLTLSVLEKALTSHHLEQTLLKALNCIQGNYYIELVLLREKDEVFLRGWLDNRITFSE